MKYKTVKLTPSGDKWLVTWSESNMERVKTKTKPHPLGFYHYPETMSDQEALKALVNCMLKAHTEEISRLNKSLSVLKNVLRLN